jgi:CHAD domain-containing protein
MGIDRITGLTRRQASIIGTGLRLCAEGASALGTTEADATRATEAALRDIAQRMAAVVRVADGVSPHKAQISSITDDDRGIRLGIPDVRRTHGLRATWEEACDLWNAVMLRKVTRIEPDTVSRPIPLLLHPRDTIAEAGYRIVKRQLEQVISRERGLRYRDDVEYVHEMRIATRRIRSAMRVFKAGFASEILDRKHDLRRLADTFGNARDSDVLLAFLTRCAGRATDSHRAFLQDLIRNEKARRSRRYRALLAYMESDEYKRLRDTLYSRICAGPLRGEGASAAAAPLAREAPRSLRRALKKVMKYEGRLSALSPDHQHALRIACKRLRYGAEFLCDIYPDRLKGVITAAAKMQSLLGNVHDADVYQERIRQLVARRRRTREPGYAVREETALGADLQSWRRDCLERAETVWAGFCRSKTQKKIRAAIASPYPCDYPSVGDALPAGITVNGRLHAGDVYITADGKTHRRKKAIARAVYGTPHLVGPAELRKVCRGRPSILIVGLGRNTATGVTPEGQEFLKQQGIACTAATTPEAIRLFNGERMPKAALFHVTC